MSHVQLPLPHLSPQSSREDTTLVSVEHKKRKSKRSSFLFAKKDRPDVKPTATTTEFQDTAPEITTDANESRIQGPELRLLPQEAAASTSDVPAKLVHYVELPQDDPSAQNALHPISENKIKYEWDYVMEHQRGFRFLATPLFSGAGLLPTDPPPFSTIGADPLPCTLDNFQLPSPEWRWAGEDWCVDMRWDGEVQEDGFEYNWWFRRKGWRPTIGFLSSGAFVRRRRWMRLRYLTPPESISEKSEHLTSPPLQHHNPDELQGWAGLEARLKDTDLDRERLDTVKAWLDETNSNEDLLREHWIETMRLLVFPSSQDQLREMVKSMGWTTLPAGDEVIFWKEAA